MAVFHNLKEVDQALIKANRIAMKNTLEKLKEDLYDFIENDVYGTISDKYSKEENLGNLNTVKWSGRTYSLLDPRTVETYIYNAFGKGVGGGIRFNDQAYYQNSNIHNFVHGNEVWGELAFTSYLEVMNDSSKLKPNRWHFPTGNELHRRSFMEDFLRYANANFKDIYAGYLNVALGVKPNLRGLGKNKNINSGMNLSQSTSHLPSMNTHNVNY